MTAPAQSQQLDADADGGRRRAAGSIKRSCTLDAALTLALTVSHSSQRQYFHPSNIARMRLMQSAGLQCSVCCRLYALAVTPVPGRLCLALTSQ